MNRKVPESVRQRVVWLAHGDREIRQIAAEVGLSAGRVSIIVKAARIERICIQCGYPFAGRRRTAKTCSLACYRRYRWAQEKEASP